MPKLIALLTTLLLCVAPALAQAAKIYWAAPIPQTFVVPFPVATLGDGLKSGDKFDFKSYLHIRIEGDIAPGDAEKFTKLITEKGAEIFDTMSGGVNLREVVVSFNSGGGDFYAGLKLSDAIRGFATYVGKGDRCLSACAVAFLGGRVRMLRGYPEWPARYVHSQGVVGFHAPFSSLTSNLMIPDGTPFSAQLGRQIALQFYAQAQDAINELTRRMDDWKLSPNFVFAMIGKKFAPNDTRPLSEQFLLINTYAALEETRTILLADRVLYPRQIGMEGAINACDYLIYANTGRHGQVALFPMASAAIPEHGPFGEGPVGEVEDGVAVSYKGFPTSGGPAPRLRTKADGQLDYHTLLPAAGDNSFYFSGTLSGPGRMECNAYLAGNGHWYGQSYSRDVHTSDPNLKYQDDQGTLTIARDVLDRDHPYLLNNFTLRGPNGPWNNFPTVKPPPDSAPIVARFGEVTRPSFDCGGTLDPAAHVVCQIRPLGVMDGVMAALYRAASKHAAKGLRASQRHWLLVRDRTCRPGSINQDDPLQYRNLIDCLVNFYDLRIVELNTLAEQH